MKTVLQFAFERAQQFAHWLAVTLGNDQYPGVED
jgi:hypothetical protein